jgi:Cu/Ag efflux protein CusF
MMRWFAGTVLVALVCAGSLPADEITGKVTKVDAQKSKVTLSVDHKDMTYEVAKDVQVLALVGKGSKATFQPNPDGLKGLQEGTNVKLLREPKNGKDLITEIKIITDMPKKKKKNK